MKTWICYECSFGLEELTIGHARAEDCAVCDRQCCSDGSVELRGGYFSESQLLAGWRRERAQRIDAELAIKKLGIEQATCFELMKHWQVKPHVDQPLPKFLFESITQIEEEAGERAREQGLD